MSLKINIQKFMGIPATKKTLDEVLEGIGGKQSKHSSKKPNKKTAKFSLPSSFNKNEFIQLPSGIYMSKKRDFTGLTWNDAHAELAKQELRMPTIPEFIEYLNYLRGSYQKLGASEKQEANSILDDIYAVRDPWRAEWLDAYFEERNDGMYVLTHNKTKAEKLQSCLMTDKEPGISLSEWLSNSTNQGLPNKKIKKGDLWYWYPRAEAVAWFDAGSDWAVLDCGRGPDLSNSSLGVFACAEGATKNP